MLRLENYYKPKYVLGHYFVKNKKIFEAVYLEKKT